MKKAVTALCCAVFLIAGCLSGCSAERTVLTVGDTEIGSEVYLYYLDVAVRESAGTVPADSTAPVEAAPESAEPVVPESADASAPSETVEPATAATRPTETSEAAGGALTAQALYDRATELCAEYLAVNSLFEAYNCSLTAAEKSDVSVMTNDLWRLYGRYYESIGVSKETYYKIQLSEAYRDAVLTALYGTEGVFPTAEEELRQAYEAHNIVFRAISGYYTNVDENGSSVPMNAEERATIDSAFDNMAERINSGTDMETAYNDYLETLSDGEANETIEVRTATAESAGYPAGFFEAVHALSQDTASVVRLGDYIYVIVRLDPYMDDSIYYEDARTDALRSLRSEEFEAVIRTTAAEYQITPSASAQRSCLNKIQEQYNDLVIE